MNGSHADFSTPDRRSWHAVQAVALKEQLAVRHLLHQGFDVFWPHYLAQIRDGTRRGYAFRSWLPPSWMFIAEGDAEDVAIIKRSMGVLNVLQINDQPLAISYDELLGLRAIADPSGLVHYARPKIMAPNNMTEIKGTSLLECLHQLNGLKLRTYAKPLTGTDKSVLDVLTGFTSRRTARGT